MRRTLPVVSFLSLVMVLSTLLGSAEAAAAPNEGRGADTAASPQTGGGSEDVTRSPNQFFRPGRCPVALPPGYVDGKNVTCGFVTVGFTWKQGYSRARATALRLKITPIQVAVLVAKAAHNRGKAPVFYLAGGPGQGSLSVASQLLGTGESIDTLGADHDLVFIDQRGSGYSRPSLNCPEVDVIDLNLSGSSFNPVDRKAITACKTRLNAKGVNLAQFNVAEHLSDYVIAGAALGYRTASIYGVGYGADLGLQLSAQAGFLLKSALLESIDGPRANFILDSGVNYQVALNKLYADCAAATDCKARYGDLRTTVASVLKKVTANPPSVQVRDPLTGQDSTVVLSDQRLAEGLFTLIGSTNFIAYLPSALTRADRGSYVSLATLIAISDDSARSTTLSEGTFLSTICAREGSVGSPQQARRRAKNTDRIVKDVFLKRGFLQVYDRCDIWNVPQQRNFNRPVKSNVPTLLVAGRFDPIAPPRYAKQVLKGLSHGQLVVIDRGGRAPLPGADACGGLLTRSFFDHPQRRFDNPCVDQPVTFFVPATGV